MYLIRELTPQQIEGERKLSEERSELCRQVISDHERKKNEWRAEKGQGRKAKK